MISSLPSRHAVELNSRPLNYTSTLLPHAHTHTRTPAKQQGLRQPRGTVGPFQVANKHGARRSETANTAHCSQDALLERPGIGQAKEVSGWQAEEEDEQWAEASLQESSTQREGERPTQVHRQKSAVWKILQDVGTRKSNV